MADAEDSVTSRLAAGGNGSSPTSEYTSEEIQVLKGLEGVRRRPAMYIGDTGEGGLHELVKEIVNNSVDEAMAGRCSRIEVTVMRDGSVRIEDDGQGIPTGIHPGEGKSGVEVVMTMLHAGGKFDKKAYQVSGGLHGVGASVVNALSESLVVEVSQSGKIHRQRFERGVARTPLEVIGETDGHGTMIQFRPDRQIFETVDFDVELISHRLRELAFLNKGLEIRAGDEISGRTDTYLFEGGVVEFVAFLNEGCKALHPGSDLPGRRAQRRQRRDRHAVQRQLPRVGLHLCEQHQDGRRRHPPGRVQSGPSPAPSTPMPSVRTCSRPSSSTSAARTRGKA